ncbi:hypothetical protein IFM61606_06534 [Aspergillus udagawae]|nr:hypothetical protein IFM61606_06534 [Aspergillus udagawae]
MGETFNIEAAYVDLTSPKDGDNEWTVEQTEAAAELSIPDQAREFSWSFGAISASQRPTASDLPKSWLLTTFVSSSTDLLILIPMT